MNKELEQMIHDRFKSGNSIDVERITITRSEYEEAIKSPEQKLADAFAADFPNSWGKK